METKKLLVSFFVIASVLFLMSTVIAGEITNNYTVYVDGHAIDADTVAVVEGDTINLKVVFTSLVDGSGLKVKAEIDGYDVEAETGKFDVVEGRLYRKSFTMKIPYNLQDEIEDNAELEVRIYNKDDETKLDTINLWVQRESYNAGVMSISTQNAEAGALFPVDIVLKNKGYNNLDDLYVTVKITGLGVEKTSYFGDLVALESDLDDDEDTDTVSGRIYLQIPDNAKTGTYTLEVTVENDDTTTVKTKEVFVDALEETLIKSGNELIIVNPSNKVKVYKVVSDTTEQFVVVSAGSSKSVEIKSGEYNVFDGNELVGKVVFGAEAGTKEANPVIIWTVVLAVVLIVLLIVLFVLVGKKPEAEEFGESYY